MHVKSMWGLAVAFSVVAGAVEMPVPAGAKVVEVGGACATIEDALDCVAEIRRTDTATPLVVRIAPGDYAPARALEITRRHAATNWASLTVCAADPARKPRIHGGRRVTGWTRTTFNGRDVWCADVSNLAIPKDNRLFFFSGRRMQPARRGMAAMFSALRAMASVRAPPADRPGCTSGTSKSAQPSQQSAFSMPPHSLALRLRMRAIQSGTSASTSRASSAQTATPSSGKRGRSANSSAA